MKHPKSILFLGETYRADAQTWIRGIQNVSGLSIHTLEVKPSSTRLRRILGFLGFGLKILKTNFFHSYDLVLAERATSYGFFSLFVRAKKRIVAQQGITDAWPEEGFSGVYKRFLQTLVYKKVDLIHAWGQVMVAAMLQSGASPDKILVLPKGINLENFKFQIPSESQPMTAIVTRSMTKVYRHEDLIHALYLLKKKGEIIQLILVGDGDQSGELKELTSQLGIQDQVSFKGRVPNDLLPELLGQSHIYLSVPETEGVSASLFEAMACGCFPIVTDLPGTRAFINSGQNGFLVQVGNPDQLAQALSVFLNNPSKYADALYQNRKMIEENVDLNTNMRIIWNKYISVFQS